jgi:2,3-bisphosphoglycerate-dependent phosphoglycerate mutase
LILLRHGQSEWNEQNLFTGWYDADLTELGIEEARRGGRQLQEADLLPDVVHTSLQRRAIHTAFHALAEADRDWVPVRRHWRLNERHYGDLQGTDKKQTAEDHGADMVKIWRRSYDTPPPPLDLDDPRHARFDPRYADLAPELIPASECLKDVVERMLPYWYDAVVPDLRLGRTVLIAAHGNSLRALVKHLDGISDEVITEVNIPTGIPLVYELDQDLQPIGDIALEDRYLGGAEAAKAAADAVAKQAG